MEEAEVLGQATSSLAAATGGTELF